MAYTGAVGENKWYNISEIAKEKVLQIFLNWFIPFVLGGIISFCATLIKGVFKRESAERVGIQCLLRTEIIRQHEKYVRYGYCPIYAKEALKREYAAYHDLGGNDVASKLFNELMALPEEDCEDKKDSVRSGIGGYCAVKKERCAGRDLDGNGEEL